LADPITIEKSAGLNTERDGMAEKKERRYSVDFENFENAMLTEANLGWQVFMQGRWEMSRERREKVVGLLKRFVNELAPEIQKQKTKVRELQAIRDVALKSAESHSFQNGD
jgi:hypothetical protein